MPKDDRKQNLSSPEKKKVRNTAASLPGDNENQNHNVKKEALGPNTKR